MKNLSLVFSTLAILLVASCTFYPIQDQATVDARHTAQAETLIPTTTATLEPTAVAIATEEAPQQVCLIGGNISSDGSLIYHMPDGVYYSRVHIDLDRHNSAGVHEQYFCSEEAAQAAGFRKSSR